jgi:hypothetical protein
VIQRFSLPASPPVTEDEVYAALVSWGGLAVAAESGITTELVRPDGLIAGRVVPVKGLRHIPAIPLLLLAVVTLELSVPIALAYWLIIWLVLS